MKRILVLVLTLVLLLTAGVAAVAEEQLTTTGLLDGTLSGGWQVNTTVSTQKLGKAEKKVFSKATDGLVGATYTPLAVLGTQVVAGMNYCFLCHCASATYPATNSICKMYVYQDLSGKAKITKIKELSLKHRPTGGWVLSKTKKEAKVDSAAKKALTKALETLTGADYEPLLVLGRGKNAWYLLCSKKIVAPGSSAELARVYVKKSGKTYEIAGISDLAIAR